MNYERDNYPDPKEFFKVTIPNNYRVISLLPLIWKILTVQTERIYNSLYATDYFRKEKKIQPRNKRSKWPTINRPAYHERKQNEAENNYNGVMVKALDCEIVVSEFELQQRYYVHFQTNTIRKGIKPLVQELVM